jgi:hypothetical protein
MQLMGFVGIRLSKYDKKLRGYGKLNIKGRNEMKCEAGRKVKSC